MSNAPQTPPEAIPVATIPLAATPPPRPAAGPIPPPRPRDAALSRGQGWLIILLLAAGMALPYLGTNAGKPRLTWEYTINGPQDYMLDDELRRLGSEGWELVSARRATDPDGHSPHYEMIFKRAK